MPDQDTHGAGSLADRDPELIGDAIAVELCDLLADLGLPVRDGLREFVWDFARSDPYAARRCLVRGRVSALHRHASDLRTWLPGSGLCRSRARLAAAGGAAGGAAPEAVK